MYRDAVRIRSWFLRSSVVVGALVAACGETSSGSPPRQQPTKAGTPTAALTPDLGLAPNAPADKPVTASGDELNDLHRAIAPYVDAARRTWPGAKQRYLDGLSRGERFFVTTTLRSPGADEIVFIAVSRIVGDSITGTIASDLLTVKGYRTGESYTLAEADLVDWLITKPDGSEEGNVVGKFLDQRNASR